MSFHTYAVVLVGYTYDNTYSIYKELTKDWDPIDFDDWLETTNLEFIQPTYDCRHEYGLFGVSIYSADYYETLNLEEMSSKVSQEIDLLHGEYSLKPSVYITPRVF